METPRPGSYPVTFGDAELLADLDRESGWTVCVDGVPQSYVDLADPTHLDFEYVRAMGDVVDCLPPGPLAAVHVGGGACTLPRYVAATRPGSRHIVIEPDRLLVELVREQLGLRSVPRLKTWVTDGRSGVLRLADGGADLLVLDAFRGAAMPVELAATSFVADVRRVLAPAGTFLLNVADGPPGLRFARRVLATVRDHFPRVALMADPAVLRGRRFGNLIVVARTIPLPISDLVRRCAGGMVRRRFVHGEDMDRFIATNKPILDGEEIAAPVPPPAVFTGQGHLAR